MNPPSTTDLLQRSNLTQGQLLIWTGQQLNPDAPLYNMAFVFSIAGRVDPTRFRQAFQLLVRQCDALRTVVRTVEGVPRQHVLSTIDDDLSLVDLSAEQDPHDAGQQWSQASCKRLFMLDRRLFDTALIKLADNAYAWYFNQHHVVCDAWSVSILFNRLNENYERLSKNDPPALPPLPAYGQYVAFERDAKHQTAAAIAHWQQVRANATPPAPLYGTAATRVNTPSQRVPIDLGDERSQRLRHLAQRPDARCLSTDLSLFNLIATTLFAYLYRVSTQRSLAIAAPAHNRPSPAFKRTIGLLTEVYPLQVEVDVDDSFLTLFNKVRTATNTFLRYATPGASDPRNNQGCNVVLNYIHASFKELCGAPVRTRWLHPGHKDREHHLRLQVHDFGDTGRLELNFDFNCDVFDPDRRDAATAHFLCLFDSMLDDWDQPITRVDLLSETDRHKQIVAFNQTAKPRPADHTVVQGFEQQAATNPDAIALVCGDLRVSYGDLNRRANQLARSLLGREVNHGRVVAICMKRCPEAVIAMLGVLKAGGAYVPIDPDWPGDRIALMLKDAGVYMVLTQTSASSPTNLPEGVQVIDVCIDQPLSQDESPRVTNPAPGSLAYVMYTSGSTGKPKGVMIPHCALANYIAWASDCYTHGSRLSFPLFTPLTFDLTVTSIFVPLVSGGRIVIYPETSAKADLALLDVLDDNAVDIIKLTPSHLTMIQDRDLSQSRVRQLILGGEDLTVDLAKRALSIFGDSIEIHNEYGPTEATVGCIAHRYNPQDDLGKSVPIGTPIDNMRAYVLDRHLNPVPQGVIGELYIGGAGLAVGYNHRPQMTAQRFVNCPFQEDTRLYRTGDLARLGSHGELEYLGRSDHQVKIRGARIELGEIESVIAAHPGVDACVVHVFDHRHAAAASGKDVVYCNRCGLPSNYPGSEFDANRVCNQCRAFDSYQQRAQKYFRSMRDLEAIFASQKRDPHSTYDCLALLSGGKDSTYMLGRLVDMGLKVLAFTLDNGYISEQAKANIKRVVEALGVDHIFGSTPAMNEIFVDSLRRHANVCQGCFKTIYTLSVNLAKSKGIPFIVTGLSRGQFFETRLTEALFTDPDIDADRIDETILHARKSYHRVNDAVYRLLDVQVFKDDRIFDEVRFIDFYRYCPVDLQEMMDYLGQRVPWVRPSDTGRSTNCLINDVGIYVHKQQRGYHNYALPYSWDVRMGHKTRDAALAELNDDIDIQNVQRILQEVGYNDELTSSTSEKRLVAYYTGSPGITDTQLRSRVSQALPDFMMPSHFVRLDAIPLTRHGKVDRAALPVPDEDRPSIQTKFVAPHTVAQRLLAEIWQEVLRIDRIGIHDNFFDLGGDSIMAIQIVARARRLDVHLLPAQLVDHPTIEQLARLHATAQIEDTPDRETGQVPLTPVGHWFFEQAKANPGHWNHVLAATLPEDVNTAWLKRSLRLVVSHHDAFRLRYTLAAGRWEANLQESVHPLKLQVLDTSGMDDSQRQACMTAAETELHASIDLDEPRLVAAALFVGSASPRLLLVIHHLAVDAVSWLILLEDLASVYGQIQQNENPALPSRTASLKRWSDTLTKHAESDALRDELPYWLAAQRRAAGQIPLDVDSTLPDTMASANTVRVELEPDATSALLQQIPKTARVSVMELLITALGLTLSQWTRNRSVRLFVESHGREAIGDNLDLSCTVGWLTSIYPVTLDLPQAGTMGEMIRSVKEQLRTVPARGIGYGVLRYLSRDAEIRRQLSQTDGPQVLFNYLGRADQLAPEGGLFESACPLVLSRPANTHRRYLFEVNAMVVANRLTIEWQFSTNRHHRSSVQAQAKQLITTLRSLMDHCLQSDGNEPAASDFPLANLNQNKLDKLSLLLRNKGHLP